MVGGADVDAGEDLPLVVTVRSDIGHHGAHATIDAVMRVHRHGQEAKQ